MKHLVATELLQKLIHVINTACHPLRPHSEIQSLLTELAVKAIPVPDTSDKPTSAVPLPQAPIAPTDTASN